MADIFDITEPNARSSGASDVDHDDKDGLEKEFTWINPCCRMSNALTLPMFEITDGQCSHSYRYDHVTMCELIRNEHGDDIIPVIRDQVRISIRGTNLTMLFRLLSLNRSFAYVLLISQQPNQCILKTRIR